MLSFIVFCLVVFAVSSGWLFSELPAELRKWWLKKFKGNKLEYLAICQLCCGVWFGMAISPFYFGLDLWLIWLPMSLAAAGVAWLLGAFTQCLLWMKIYYERQYKLSNGRDIKG